MELSAYLQSEEPNSMHFSRHILYKSRENFLRAKLASNAMYSPDLKCKLQIKVE